MTPEQFCYWLQGRAELQPDVPLSDVEWKSVREHLQLVFNKLTQHMYGPNTAAPVRSPMQDAIGRPLNTGWPTTPWPNTAPVITCSVASSELTKSAIY